MGKLLVEKKKLDAQKKDAKGDNTKTFKIKEKIDQKQKDAKKILADLKQLKEKR